MKKLTLNKDGTPRRRRNSSGKGGTAIVTLSVDEIMDLAAQDVSSIPVSEDWVKGRLYANYLANKKFPKTFRSFNQWKTRSNTQLHLLIMNNYFDHLIGQDNVKKKLNFYIKAYHATSVCPFLNLVGAQGFR